MLRWSRLAMHTHEACFWCFSFWRSMNTEGDIKDSFYLLLGWTKLCDVGVVAVPLWPGQWLSRFFGCKLGKLRVGGLAHGLHCTRIGLMCTPQPSTCFLTHLLFLVFTEWIFDEWRINLQSLQSCESQVSAQNVFIDFVKSVQLFRLVCIGGPQGPLWA